MRYALCMKTAICDFWPSFEGSLFEALFDELGVEVLPQTAGARMLLYSNMGARHAQFHGGVKVFYTAESILPRWDECDYAIGFMEDNVLYPDCYLRLPYWVLAHYDKPATFEASPCSEEMLRRPFCSFVNSNPHNELRNRFFQELSLYKPVASGGREYNNVGGCVEDKVAFCAGYKFNLAFENYASRGYVTEKLFDAFAARTLPIYWGAPDVVEEVNPARFINGNDFSSPKELIEYVKEVDASHELYASYFGQPALLATQKTAAQYVDELRGFLRTVIESGRIERASRLFRQGYPMMPASPPAWD